MPRLTMEAVTPTTPCPTVFGGTVRHYPKCVRSVTITMPGMPLDNPNHDQTVMLALCSGTMLLPPDENENPDTAELALCRTCLHTYQNSAADPQGESPRLDQPQYPRSVASR